MSGACTSSFGSKTSLRLEIVICFIPVLYLRILGLEDMMLEIKAALLDT